jgi:hypothetical protein
MDRTRAGAPALRVVGTGGFKQIREIWSAPDGGGASEAEDVFHGRGIAWEYEIRCAEDAPHDGAQSGSLERTERLWQKDQDLPLLLPPIEMPSQAAARPPGTPEIRIREPGSVQND